MSHRVGQLVALFLKIISTALAKPSFSFEVVACVAYKPRIFCQQCGHSRGLSQYALSYSDPHNRRRTAALLPRSCQTMIASCFNQ